MHAYERIQIFGHGLMKYVHRKSLICRVGQEQAQKLSTRSKHARDDEKLKLTKYMQDKDFGTYQKF